MHISYKISRGYYLTKNNKIIQVVIFFHGSTKYGYKAKIALWGKSEEEAFWVDGHRVSWNREYIEKMQKELQKA